MNSPPPPAGPSSNGHFSVVALEPPHNLDAERNVIGACMLHEDAFVACSSRVKARDFYLHKHETIWDALVNTHASTGQTDPLLVADELGRRRRLDDVGGTSELVGLASDTVTSVGVEFHADLVAKASRARELLAFGRRVEERVRQHLDDPFGSAILLADELQAIAVPKTQPKSSRESWSLVSQEPEMEWLLESVLPRGGNVVIAGDPGTGKSVVALDLALRAAHGMQWLGRDLVPHSTLYFCGEGQGGLAQRIRAWKAAHAAERSGGFYVDIVKETPCLLDLGAVDRMSREIAAATKEHGHAPDVVVIDTLTTATAGSDISDVAAIGKAMSVLSKLREQWGCCTSTLHHRRKPTGDRSGGRDDIHSLLGSIGIPGACDAILLASRKDDLRTLRAIKVRDGEDGMAVGHFTIAPMATGRTRKNGRPEMGPILVKEADPVAEEARSDSKALEADVIAVVAAIAREGRTSPMDAIGPLASLSRDRGRVAVRLAVNRGLLVSGGKTSDKWYDLPTRQRTPAEARAVD